MTRGRKPRFRHALLAAGALLVLATGCRQEEKLVGTDLVKVPAPDFALTDHRGEIVRLSNFRGKAVALTFIYANCPDICPLTAEYFRAAYEHLPAEHRDDVVLLAVTVDPERDTTAALADFSERHRLVDNPSWHALGGDRTTLERVWRDYGIDPGAMLTRSHESGGILAHTDAVYLIDPDGRERVLLRSDLDYEVLSRNLQTLVD